MMTIKKIRVRIYAGEKKFYLFGYGNVTLDIFKTPVNDFISSYVLNIFEFRDLNIYIFIGTKFLYKFQITLLTLYFSITWKILK